MATIEQYKSRGSGALQIGKSQVGSVGGAGLSGVQPIQAPKSPNLNISTAKPIQVAPTPRAEHVPNIPDDFSGQRGRSLQLSAEQAYLTGLGRLVGAAGDFAKTYESIVDERIARDASTYASKVFRERRLQVLQTVKGEAADGLLNKEDEWAKGQYNKFREQYKLSGDMAEKIWGHYTEQYLDRTGAYQVEQQAVADKNSRFRAADAIVSDLASTPLGDTASIKEAFAKVDELFVNDYGSARAFKKEAFQSAVTLWSRQNPRKALAWFNSNQESLKQQFGRDFEDVTGIMLMAENRIKTEEAHAMAMADRQERLAEKARKTYEDKVVSDVFTLIARDEFTLTDLHAVTDDPRLSGSLKASVFSAYTGVQSFKDSDQRRVAAEHERDFTIRINKAGGITPEIREDMLKSAELGNLGADEFRRLDAYGSQYAKAATPEIMPVISNVMSYFEDTYAQKSWIGQPPNREQVSQLASMKSTILKWSQDMSPQEFIKATDLNDVNSPINKLILANPPMVNTKPTIRPNTDSSWSPVTANNPFAKPDTTTTNGGKLPGETPEQYEKRVGL